LKKLQLIVNVIFLFVFLFSCTNMKKPSENKETKRQEQYVVDIDLKFTKAISEKDILEMIKLINGGADPNIVIDGQPVIYMATINGWDELVIALVNNGANLFCKFESDITFIDIAVHRLNEETLLSIMDNGFDVMKLTDSEINDVFSSAIFQRKIEFLRRLIAIDGFPETINENNKHAVDFMRFWINGTGNILDELVRIGFVLPDDGSLYYYIFLENRSYEAVEWLISHGFSTSVFFEGKSISYWADINLSQQRKIYDGSKQLPEDSPNIINAKKIKDLIVMSTN